MIRFFFSFITVLILLIVEFSFLHALPTPWFFIPLTFTCALYIFQHIGSELGLWWLAALSIFLDFWQVGLVRGEFFVYAAAAIFAVFLGRNFFTNRSLYGVVRNALFTLWFLHALHFIWLWIKNLGSETFFSWSAFGIFVFWQTLWLMILTILLFFLSKRIRLFLNKIF